MGRRTARNIHLAKPDDADPVLAALRRLTAVDDDDRPIVADINGVLWARWRGQLPSGAPPADPLLQRDAHLRDTGGDLFLYLKGNSADAIDALLALNIRPTSVRVYHCHIDAINERRQIGAVRDR